MLKVTRCVVKVAENLNDELAGLAGESHDCDDARTHRHRIHRAECK